MSDRPIVERATPWGICPDGSTAECFHLRSEEVSLEVMTYGARVTALSVPDRHGNQSNIVLGHAALAPYLTDKAFLGCSVGRYANRIAKGSFQLTGQTYRLDINDPPNTLHGGAGGFPHRNWDARILPHGVEFSIQSRDGDQGFPGAVHATARYLLKERQITLEYEATTDRTTVVNLTNHAYFNLAGEGTSSVLDHEVQLEAEAYLPVDATAIPLGAPAPVAGTPFDFTTLRRLDARIQEPDTQLLHAKGYDHNFILRGGDGLRPAAKVVHAATGRQLSIATTEPGVQLYSGNYLDGTVLGRSGRPYLWRSALCLETQHWPDSPNHPEYPTTVLQPGETFRSVTVWTFDTV